MGRSYESITALVNCAVGPVRSHLRSFIASLIDQRYTANVIYIKVRHAVAFDRWLAKHRVVLADLGEVHIERALSVVSGRDEWHVQQGLGVCFHTSFHYAPELRHRYISSLSSNPSKSLDSSTREGKP